MFDFIKKMLTETSNSNIAFAKLPVTYSCRHQGRGRSRYFNMLGPSALENYLQFLGTTKCAECVAVERATEKARENPGIASTVDASVLRPAA